MVKKMTETALWQSVKEAAQKFFGSLENDLNSGKISKNTLEQSQEVLQIIASVREKSVKLLSFIDHDLKTHLAGLKIFLHGISKDNIIEEQKKKMASEIKIIRSGIQSLDFWFDSQNIKLEKVLVGDFFNDSLKRGLESVGNERKTSISIAPEAQNCMMEIHPGTIDTLLMNMSRNSYKHSYAEEIALTVSREDNFICISLADNGSGIAAEKAAHLFKTTTEPKTGRIRQIGLAQAPKRLKLMGGKIIINPKNGLSQSQAVKAILQEEGLLTSLDNNRGAEIIIKIPVVETPNCL